MDGETPGSTPENIDQQSGGFETPDSKPVNPQKPGGNEDLNQKNQEQEKKDKGLIEKIREKLRFFDKARSKSWEAMGETDQLAIVTKKLEGQLQPGQVGFTIEVFTGSPRTEVSRGVAEKVLVMTDNTAQAKGIHSTIGEKQQVIVASPHALPFKVGVLDRIVDPHKLTHVGPKDEESLGTPLNSIRNLYREMRAFMKEKKGDIGFLAFRPQYVSKETHGEWVSKFENNLMERSQSLSKDGKLVFSVGVRPENWPAESGYMAHVAQVGEVFLSPTEIKQSIEKAGLKVDAAYAGMGPRSQRLHVENAVKAVVMSTTGWGFERFADEMLLPVVHSAINTIGKRGGEKTIGELSASEIQETMRLERVGLDHFEESRTSGLASARTPEGKFQPPDRIIIVASKEE